MEFSIAMLVCKVYGYGRTPMAWGDHTRIPNMELLDTGVFSLFLEGGSAQTCLFHLLLRVQIGRFTYVVPGVGSNRFWSRKRWCVETMPIGSMVLVYMLTWLGYIDGIHVTINIAAPWILWDGNTMQPVMKATEVMGGRLKVRFFPLTPRKGDFVPWLQGWHYPKRRLYVKTIDSLFMFIIYIYVCK